MDDLAGRTAVVTGAASGIGLGLARRFAAEGMNVVMADIDEPALVREAELLVRGGNRVLAVGTDVSNASEVERLAAEAKAGFGDVDILCNNAGVGSPGDPWSGPLTYWQWTIGVNLMGVIHGVRTFLPGMRARGEGHIVNTASMAGLLPHPLLAYTATKYAVVGLSESLAAMEASLGTGVGVSLLCPGFVKTNILNSERAWPSRLGTPPSAPPGSDVALEMIRETMESRGMDPADVASLVMEGVRRRSFWILTQPDYLDLIRARGDGIGSAAPTFPPLV